MKVFLSSTYIDLIDHRRAATEALERLGHQVERMEIFGARPEEPKQACLAEIGICDLFVGLYAHRYGHVPAGSNSSITEEEFHHAKKHNKPLFCFLVDEDHPWPPKMIEDEPGKSRLQALKAKISGGLVRDSFTTPEDLGFKIATSVGRYLAQLKPSEVGTTRPSTLERELKEVETFLEKGLLRLQDASVTEISKLPQPSTSTSFLPIPLTPDFVGRDSELETLHKGFARCRVILVEGLIGIGKTYLAAYFANQIRNEYAVLWFECQVGSTLGDLFEAFGKYATQQKIDLLREAVRDTRERATRTKLVDLLEILDQNGKFVLFFDSYHLVRDEYLKLFVREFTRHCRKARLVIVARERPKYIGDLSPYVTEVPVGPFNESEALQYLRILGLEEEEHILKQVFARTEGHPYWMKVFVPLVQKYNYSPLELQPPIPGVDTRLGRDLLALSEKLPESEALLLERFSVFVEPVPKNALRFIYREGKLEEVLELLIDKFLIDPAPNNRFAMHRLIRQFFLGLSRYQEEIHWRAGQYYLEGCRLGYAEDLDDAEVEKRLKAHYYFRNAGDYSRAEDIVYSVMDTLYMTGRYEKLMDLLNLTLQRSENPHIRIRKAAIHRIWGDIDTSKRILEELLEHLDDHIVAIAKRDLAYLTREEGDYDQALRMYEEVLPEFISGGDKPNEAMTKHQMATAYHRKSQQAEEGGLHEESLELADLAHVLYEHSLNVDRAVGRKSRIPIHLNKVGLLYQEKGQFQEAMEVYNECLRIQEELGLRRSMSQTLQQMAMIAEEQGHHRKAAEWHEKSKEVFPISKSLQQ